MGWSYYASKNWVIAGLHIAPYLFVAKPLTEQIMTYPQNIFIEWYNQ